MSKMQDMFFSIGLKDNTVIEWKVDFINDFDNFAKPFKEDTNIGLNIF